MIHDLFTNYQTSTLKDLILRVLIMEARPLRQVEIENLLKKQYPQKIIRSSGAISLSIKDLVSTSAVLAEKSQFQQGVRKDTKFYSINPQYIDAQIKFYHNYYDKVKQHFNTTKPERETVYIRSLLEQPHGEITFRTLKEADLFVHELIIYLIKYGHLTDPRIIGEFLWNRWWVYPEPKLAEAKHVIWYLLSRSKFVTEYQTNGWLHHKDVRIRTSIQKIPDNEIIIFSTEKHGFVGIELYFPTQLLHALAELQKKEATLTRDELAVHCNTLLSLEGEYVVSVKTHDVLLPRRRKNMFDTFKEAVFGRMIDGINKQLAEGKSVITIDEEYKFMTAGQAAVTREVLSKTDYDVLPTVLKQFLHWCERMLDKTKPVVLVDFGTGPAIKPVTVYTALTKLFSVTDYVAVDASKEILSLAEQDLKKYHFDLNLQFLELNFKEIAQRPNLLLNHLSGGQRIFLFLGGTYGTLVREDAIAFLSSFLKKGDLLVIDTAEVADQKDFETRILPMYLNNKDFITRRKNWELTCLYELGFHEEDFEFMVHWDENTHTQYTRAKLLSVPLTILPQFQETGLLKPGIEFQTWMNRKLTEPMLIEELRTVGLELETYLIKKDIHSDIIALCSKM